MILKLWPTPLLLVVVGFSCAGCSFPGRQAANAQNPQNGQGSAWNPFSKPDVFYAQQKKLEEEDDELFNKKISDPNSLKLHYAMWMEETGNLPEARKHFEEVLNARPKDQAAIQGIARIEFGLGHIDQAEQGFRKVLKVDPGSPTALSGLGQCFAAKQQWPEAVETLKKASQGLPEDRKLSFQLAVALVHTGDVEAAQVQFGHCVNAAAGHYNTALILKDQGHLQQAEVQLQLALRKDPKFKDAERWLTEIRKARVQSGQVSSSGPPLVKPQVTQVGYTDYGHIGTVEVQPAVYVTDAELAGVQTAGAHSAAQP